MSDIENLIWKTLERKGRRPCDPFWDLFPDHLLAKKGNEELWANCLMDLLFHTGCPVNGEFVVPGERPHFTMKKMFQGGPVEVSVSDQGITVQTGRLNNFTPIKKS